MFKVQFWVAVIMYKLCNYPSKNFLVFIVLLLAGLTSFLGGKFSPVYSMLPGFFREWSGVGFNLTAGAPYLGLFSSLLVVKASLMLLARAAFLSACALKSKYNVILVP